MIKRLPKIPNRPKKTDRENAIELAEYLHGKQCRWNHTDGCSWYYSSWDKPCGTRNSYLDKAYEMLAENNIVTIKKVLRFL
jgi:hypothetical protein